MSADCSSVQFSLGDLDIAGLHWPGQHRVIALHGWLDNAASFVPLARRLPRLNMLAPDLPGHGFSSHRVAPGAYALLDEVYLVDALLDQLGWDGCDLIGHSRGANIAFLYALARPERVGRLVCISSFAPRPLEPQQPISLLRQSLLDSARLGSRLGVSYPSLARMRRVRANLSDAAAGPLVERGAHQLANGRYVWRADRRLYAPTGQRYSVSQIYAMIECIIQPVLVLASQQDSYSDWVMRCASRLPNGRALLSEGAHHMHMDTNTLPWVAGQIDQFLVGEYQGNASD